VSHTVDYVYRVAGIRKVVDGDTIDAVLDVGLNLTATIRFRLLGVDTPERGQPGADEATAFVRVWLADSHGLTVRTQKADSFGRWLGDLHREDGTCLSRALLDAGLAVPYVR
jgi:micrococcal nuclease